MTKIRKTEPGFIGTIPHGFEIKDKNGFSTRITTQQGIDLVIEQHQKGSEPVYLSHYSNPGIEFFSVLIKFLTMHKVPYQLPKAPVHPQEGDFANVANGVGKLSASITFPQQYQFGLRASVSVVPIHINGTPFLEFRTNQGHLRISLETAKCLAEHIPRLYPHMDVFHKADQGFKTEAPKHPQAQLLSNRYLPLTGKQLEFRFKKPKTVTPKPRPKPRPRRR